MSGPGKWSLGGKAPAPAKFEPKKKTTAKKTAAAPDPQPPPSGDQGSTNNQ